MLRAATSWEVISHAVNCASRLNLFFSAFRGVWKGGFVSDIMLDSMSEFDLPNFATTLDHGPIHSTMMISSHCLFNSFPLDMPFDLYQ
jgi:hypothetical protein